MRNFVPQGRRAICVILAGGLILLPFPASIQAQGGEAYYQRGYVDASGCYPANGNIFCSANAPADQFQACFQSYTAGYKDGLAVAIRVIDEAYEAGKRAGIEQACTGTKKLIPLPGLNEPCSPERQNSFSRGMSDGKATVTADAQECRRAGLEKKSPAPPPPVSAAKEPPSKAAPRTDAGVGDALLIGGAVAVGAIAIGMAAGSSGGGGGSGGGQKCASGSCANVFASGNYVCCPGDYPYYCDGTGKCYKTWTDAYYGRSCTLPKERTCY